MTLGQAIKEIRIAQGISSKTLSRKLGFYKSYIAKVEKGELIPTKEKLVKICENLQFTEEITSFLLLDLVKDQLPQSKRESFEALKPQMIDLLVEFAKLQRNESNIANNNDWILIMKGGGIKGIAYIGAIEELEKHYQFNWYAGTSAGAISAILLACGYTNSELKDILFAKDFNDFRDANPLSALLNLIIHHGLYKADKFTNWLSDLLATKLNSPVNVLLKNLPHRVTVYASKRNRRALIFDSKKPDTANMDAAFSGRCSMSIPFIFTPQKDQGLNVYDGGTQNNYPVQLILEESPDAKFIGLYLGSPVYNRSSHSNNPFSDLFSIWSESNDIENLTEFAKETIIIDPTPISTLDFKLSKAEKEYLIEAGRVAAKKFLNKVGKAHIPQVEINNLETELSIKRRRIQSQRKRKKFLKVSVFIIIILSVYFWGKTGYFPL